MRLWIESAQEELKMKDWKKNFCRLGIKMNNSNQLVVGSRMSAWLKDNWNRECFILLPPGGRFTMLYLKYMHEKDHADPETTIAKIRSNYWIPRCRPKVQATRSKCVDCRKRDLRIAGQAMGMLPVERLKPSPPFYNCAVDFTGPYTIRDSVKKQSRGKVS